MRYVNFNSSIQIVQTCTGDHKSTTSIFYRMFPCSDTHVLCGKGDGKLSISINICKISKR